MSFFIVKNQKPIEHITEIMKRIHVNEQCKYGFRGGKLFLNSCGHQDCLLLYEGVIALYRADGILNGFVHAPSILNVNQSKGISSSEVYVRFLSDSTYTKLRHDNFMSLIDENNLWKELSFVCMYTSWLLSEASSSIIGHDTYRVIANSLYDIISMDKELARNVNACGYIMEKTGLSRSIVMRYLGRLGKCGGIIIKRGVLVSVVNIPESLL